MNKILTAEEKLKANFFNGSFIEIHSGDLKDIENIMIEFAKYHVEQALKEASESNMFSYHSARGRIYKEVYPLENIK